MIIWWSKYVGVILNVLMCNIWINVLIQTIASVGPLYIIMKLLRVTCNSRELEKFYSEPNTVNVIESSRLRCAGHVVRMDENELPIE
jgi:hypothetical protein